MGVSHECDHPPGVERLTVLTRPREALPRGSGAIDRTVREILRSALSVYEIDLDRLREARPVVFLLRLWFAGPHGGGRGGSGALELRRAPLRAAPPDWGREDPSPDPFPLDGSAKLDVYCPCYQTPCPLKRGRVKWLPKRIARDGEEALLPEQGPPL